MCSFYAYTQHVSGLSYDMDTLYDYSFAQRINSSYPKIIGRVIDGQTSEGLLYVNVVLLNPKDSSMINGTITDGDGNFVLETKTKGVNLLRLSFIGYRDRYLNVNMQNSNINLGNLKMQRHSSMLRSAEIVAERSQVEYQLDRRVFNVDKNIVSSGGTASDILEGIPSVTINDNGDVTLRGGNNVSVLIDGRPSELYGDNIGTLLQMMPASTIEDIEIITNPSARYTPDGMSGIINIKLKKRTNKGFDGNFSIAAGSGRHANSDFGKVPFPIGNTALALNYSTDKYSLFLSANAKYTDNLSYGLNDKKIVFKGQKANVFQQRYARELRLFGEAKVGGEWYIDKYNTLSAFYSVRGGGTAFDQDKKERLYSWQKGDEGNKDNANNYMGLEYSTFNMLFNAANLNYEKLFDTKGQRFSIDANFNYAYFITTNEQTKQFDESSPVTFFLRSPVYSTYNRYNLSIDYTHPFNNYLKMDVGYNNNLALNYSRNDFFGSKVAEKDPNMSYQFWINENINSLYSTLGFYLDKTFSALIGLRGEYVIRDGRKLQNNKESLFPQNQNTKNYFSFYPSLHIFYNISESQSAQVSYSKRIQRPRYTAMTPTVDINNPSIITFGNPDILPEYTDAFEINYNKIFSTTTIFTSLYYKYTTDAITKFNFVWNEENARKYGFVWVDEITQGKIGDDFRIASTFKNLISSSNYGVEIIVDQKITSFWKAYVSANVYGSYADGRNWGGDLIRTINFDVKLNTTIDLPRHWSIQLLGQYESKRKNIQGYQDARFWVDGAIRRDILNKKGNISLRFSDIFNTKERCTYTFTENFEQYQIYHRTTQSIILSFNYNFGVKTDHKAKEDNQQNPFSLENDD
ncbi:MAG: TonB-dependent receptor family protein [Bacteroidales bacterium]|nr:TonB-dependent receptor family protein [Bacteroidales bacterium]